MASDGESHSSEGRDEDARRSHPVVEQYGVGNHTLERTIARQTNADAIRRRVQRFDTSQENVDAFRQRMQQSKALRYDASSRDLISRGDDRSRAEAAGGEEVKNPFTKRQVVDESEGQKKQAGQGQSLSVVQQFGVTRSAAESEARQHDHAEGQQQRSVSQKAAGAAGHSVADEYGASSERKGRAAEQQKQQAKERDPASGLGD